MLWRPSDSPLLRPWRGGAQRQRRAQLLSLCGAEERQSSDNSDSSTARERGERASEGRLIEEAREVQSAPLPRLLAPMSRPRAAALRLLRRLQRRPLPYAVDHQRGRGRGREG